MLDLAICNARRFHKTCCLFDEFARHIYFVRVKDISSEKDTSAPTSLPVRRWWVSSSVDPDVGLSILILYVMLSILLSILVCAAASLFCACLVSVQVSAPYVIAGSRQDLYTCLFRHMARLLLKMSRCLAYAAQPAMILRCTS